MNMPRGVYTRQAQPIGGRITEPVKFYQELITQFDRRAKKIIDGLPEHSAAATFAATTMMDNIKIIVQAHSDMERLKLYSIGTYLGGRDHFAKRYNITREEKNSFHALYPDLNQRWLKLYAGAKHGEPVTRFKEHYPKILEALKNRFTTDESLATAIEDIRQSHMELRDSHPEFHQQLISELNDAFSAIDAPDSIKKRVFFGNHPLVEKVTMSPEQFYDLVNKKMKEFQAILDKCLSVDFNENRDILYKRPALTDGSERHGTNMPQTERERILAFAFDIPRRKRPPKIAGTEAAGLLNAGPDQAVVARMSILAVVVNGPESGQANELPGTQVAGLLESPNSGDEDHEVRERSRG